VRRAGQAVDISEKQKGGKRGDQGGDAPSHKKLSELFKWEGKNSYLRKVNCRSVERKV